jgi:hypothetical protein
MFRHVHRCLAVLVLCLQFSLPAALLVTQTSCGEVERSQAVAIAKEVWETAQELKPVFEAAGLSIPGSDSSGHLSTAITTGKDLYAAFNDNRDADALTLTAALINVIDKDIFSDIQLIKDQSKRTWALAITAGIRIGLRRISNFLKPAEDAGMIRAERPGSRAAAKQRNDKDTVRRFADTKNWRCRNSVTGRFEKMEFCKNNPAQSVVETR